MENLFVIKFGGSSITKKEENKFEINREVLEFAAKELAEAIKQKPELKIALVCGVGPFGHTNVVKYNLNNGIKTPEQEKGVKQTNKDCSFVAEEVIKALVKYKIKTKYVPGYDVCVQDNKKAVSFDAKPYKEALEKGIVPVTTGIMVKDKSLKWSPMSGDVVIAELARQLAPEKVVMGTDVDGIFTADPKKNPNAELITEISKQNLAEVLERVGESKATDVTGGMKGKLEKLAEQLGGVEAQIFNLLSAGNLKKALLGQKLACTRIRL